MPRGGKARRFPRDRRIAAPCASVKVLLLMADLIAACQDRRWDKARAARLLRETLARVAAAYRPVWQGRYCVEYHQWLVPEARIEAAALVRDMLEFVRALVAYEHFALQRFAVWAREEAR